MRRRWTSRERGLEMNDKPNGPSPSFEERGQHFGKQPTKNGN